MNPRERNFRELFGAYQFRVPIFQRRYEWKREQHERLWKSLMRQYGRGNRVLPPHFMGAVVLAPGGKTQSPELPHQFIVDGQQRLVTMSVLLAVIAYRTNGGLQREALKSLVNADEEGPNRFKILPGEHDREAYRLCIELADDDFPDGRHLIAKAWEYFDEKVDDLVGVRASTAKLRRLQAVVLDRTKFIEIPIDEGLSPHEIFETLNHDGVKLSQTDLVRNYLFMNLEGRADDVYNRVWRDVEEDLEGRQLADFLLARVLANPKLDLDWRIQRNTLFKSTREMLEPAEGDSQAMERAIVGMARDGRIFEEILNPEPGGGARTKRCTASLLLDLQDWGAHSIEPVVFFVYRRWHRGEIGPSDLLRSLHILESFLVRWMLSGRNQSPLVSFFRTMLGSDSFNRDARSMASALRGYLLTRETPTDADVRRALEANDFYNPRNRRQQFLVLRRLAYARQYENRSGDLLLNAYDPEAQQVAIDARSWEIDHIMPQDHRKWRPDLTKWKVPPDQVSAAMNKIGNLCLVPHPHNEASLNAPWTRGQKPKRDWYQTLTMAAHRDIAKYERWRVNEINERTDKLIRLALKVWPSIA